MTNLKKSYDYKPACIQYVSRRAIALALGLSTSLLSAPAMSMDLQTAIEIAVKTNPEIAEASANRRAIDFEYEQARRLNRPSVIFEGRFGPEIVDSQTTRVLGNDDTVLFGRQASVTLQQNLLSFGRNNAERDRQASRVDAAAFRVRERSELVTLDVVQAYLDIMRLREIIDFADQNVAFHENKVSEITRGVSGGVKSEADAQQARERLSAAKISRSESEEALDIAGSDFRRLVGQNIGEARIPQSILAKIPTNLAQALGEARKNNPTLSIANTDLDTARANYRAAKADLKPELLFELVGRAGDDIGGFQNTSNDARAQMRFRYEFRGGIKASAVQEQINRVDESRARIMTLERNVESLVREAWATRNRTSRRVNDLQNQVSEGTKLLDSYTREFDVSRRTLLDILDAEASLFQAQTSLSTAKYADIFAQYRLLAATGKLLNAFNVDAPREADTSLRALEKVEPTPFSDTEKRRYPKHFEDTLGKINYTSDPIARTIEENKAIDLAKVDVRPVIRKTPSPEEAKAAIAAIDKIVNQPVRVTSQVEQTAELTEPNKLSSITETPIQTSNLDTQNVKPVTEIYGVNNNLEASTIVPSEVGSISPNITHIVTSGDTLYSIAARNQISVETLKEYNNLSSTTINLGQPLNIPNNKSYAAAITSTETIEPYYSASWPTGPVEVNVLPTIDTAENFTEVEVIRVNKEKFDSLLIEDGAKHNVRMGTVSKDNKIYILDI